MMLHGDSLRLRTLPNGYVLINRSGYQDGMTRTHRHARYKVSVGVGDCPHASSLLDVKHTNRLVFTATDDILSSWMYHHSSDPIVIVSEHHQTLSLQIIISSFLISHHHPHLILPSKGPKVELFYLLIQTPNSSYPSAITTTIITTSSSSSSKQ